MTPPGPLINRVKPGFSSVNNNYNDTARRVYLLYEGARCPTSRRFTRVAEPDSRTEAVVELDESEEARRKIEREKGGGASERERVDDPLGAKSILLCDAMARQPADADADDEEQSATQLHAWEGTDVRRVASLRLLPSRRQRSTGDLSTETRHPGGERGSEWKRRANEASSGRESAGHGVEDCRGLKRSDDQAEQWSVNTARRPTAGERGQWPGISKAVRSRWSPNCAPYGHQLSDAMRWCKVETPPKTKTQTSVDKPPANPPPPSSPPITANSSFAVGAVE
ncbi:hypothetical protein V9T40_004804 [Parthenolecanium corni]|uniref:Uncharacterized protein n=1 Tax=Parthenolecanium corni TaxID=536013 RepID=A0AAN9TEI8_9HEMI